VPVSYGYYLIDGKWITTSSAPLSAALGSWSVHVDWRQGEELPSLVHSAGLRKSILLGLLLYRSLWEAGLGLACTTHALAMTLPSRLEEGTVSRLGEFLRGTERKDWLRLLLKQRLLGELVGWSLGWIRGGEGREGKGDWEGIRCREGREPKRH